MPSRKKWLQFGSGTLIFLMFCTAGFFAGYRWGHETWLEDHSRNPLTSRVYNVEDILTPGSISTQLDSLVDLIRDQAPQLPSGDPEPVVRAFPTNLSVVVTHTDDGHEHVSTLLDELRELNSRSE